MVLQLVKELFTNGFKWRQMASMVSMVSNGVKYVPDLPPKKSSGAPSPVVPARPLGSPLSQIGVVWRQR
jgi:hypothetical protein